MKSRSKTGSSTLEVLYLEHEERVRWIIRARGVSDGSVDDLVHDSFVSVHRRWPERDRSIPVATWIAGVARNVAFSHRRSEARRHRHIRALPSPDHGPSPEDVVAGREAWSAVEAFAQTLSPKLREVFLLSEVGGMPVSEVGEVTGVPVATLHSRLRLARGRFAEHLESLPTRPTRHAMLQRAAAEQAVSPEARRRSIAALMATVSTDAPVVAAASASFGAWTIAGLVSATAVSGMLIAAAASDPDPGTNPTPASIRGSGATEPQLASANPPATAAAPSNIQSAAAIVGSPDTTAAKAQPVSSAAKSTTAPTASTSAPRPNSAAPLPEVSNDPPEVLAAHLGALRRARALCDRGDHTEAIALLDEIPKRAPSLARDHRRLELRAACGAGLLARGQRAARALEDLGLRANTEAPCGPQQNEAEK